MSLNVLVKEMRVHEFCVTPSSNDLVISLFLVHELVSTNGVEATEVSPLECEKEILCGCLRLQLEPETVWVDFVTDNDEGPYPSYGLNKVESVKWQPKSLVVEISLLTLLS